MIKEACVESLNQAIKAEQQGADRIELCSRLDLDGLTPDVALVIAVRKALRIPIHVMIRETPKGNPDDFIVSDEQLEKMINSLQIMKSIDIQGFVFGVLDEECQPDLVALSQLTQYTSGLNVTFHKAIDQCAHPIQALKQIERLPGITHVLTSGGADSAKNGSSVIRQMVENSHLKIIAAGGITNQNLTELHDEVGAEEYHGKRIVGEL